MKNLLISKNVETFSVSFSSYRSHDVLCPIQRFIGSYHRSRSLIVQLTTSLQETMWWTSACHPRQTGTEATNCSAAKTCNQPSWRPTITIFSFLPHQSIVMSFFLFLRVTPLNFNICFDSFWSTRIDTRETDTHTLLTQIKLYCTNWSHAFVECAGNDGLC